MDQPDLLAHLSSVSACEQRLPEELLGLTRSQGNQGEAVTVDGQARIRWSSFRGEPSAEEQGWLLARAGYVALDASEPEHALAALASRPTPESPVDERILGSVKVTARRAPALEWVAGAAPARFEPAWVPSEPMDYEGHCPCYRIPHARPLVDHVERVGGLLLHDYVSEPLLNPSSRLPIDRALVVEDPARHRWAFYGDVAGLGDPVGAAVDDAAPASPPVPLRRWTWTQQGAPYDPVIASVTALAEWPWIWVSLDLHVLAPTGEWTWPERVVWVEGGLALQPAQGEPLLLPTATLLELLPG